MKTILKMPITNVFGQGDYSATLHLGSEKSPVNFLLDTQCHWFSNARHRVISLYENKNLKEFLV